MTDSPRGMVAQGNRTKQRDKNVAAGFQPAGENGRLETGRHSRLLLSQQQIDDPAAAANLGAKGRRWMGRILTRMGDILEQEQKLEEAKKTWELIVQTKLPGESAARKQLARYNFALEGGL